MPARPRPFAHVLALLSGTLLLALSLFALYRGTRGRDGTPLASSAPPPASSARPPELERSLAEIRSRALHVAAPTWPSQRLAFGKGRLAWLRDDAVRVLTLALELAQQDRRALTLPLAAPRAVMDLPGGALLCIGARQTLRLEPGRKEPERLPRLPFLPGSEALPERRDPQRVWVLHRPARSVSRYALIEEERPLLPIEATIELPEGFAGPFAVLRDGSWFYALDDGFEARLPEGKARRFARSSDGALWRLLPGPRVDDAWAVSEAGRARLVRLLDRLHTTRTLDAGHPQVDAGVARVDAGVAPVDADASERFFGLVLVREGGDARTFSLRVWDQAHVLGDQIPTQTGANHRVATLALDVELGAEAAPSSDDWTARLLGRELALHDDPPLAAVLDPSGLRVWDLRSGQQIFQEGAASPAR